MSTMAAKLVAGAVLSASLQYLQFPFVEARPLMVEFEPTASSCKLRNCKILEMIYTCFSRSGQSNSNYEDEKREMIEIFERLEFITVDLNLVEGGRVSFSSDQFSFYSDDIEDRLIEYSLIFICSVH
ncbi:hypothetical protein TIFTF001_012419 [Ficus carica]|uniref:Uncharacterized protein n=1 Tax=Ficus carica TaxID=3494 RepID=A0AA88D576_FICCA|nr:hypothetical protein TIFTF001_012419 [Ficus carica]